MNTLIDIATDILAVLGFAALVLGMSWFGAWLEHREALRGIREPRRKMRVVKGGREC